MSDIRFYGFAPTGRPPRRDYGKGFGAFVVLVFFALVVLGKGSCAPGPDKAASTLRAMGFRDVKVTTSHTIAPSFYGCGESDSVGHEAQATNANGERVSVVVCCGMWTKGCTVRSQ